MFDALFIHGDSSENIKQTHAAKSEKGKMVINAIMGVGSKDRNKLGNGVYKKWAVAKMDLILFQINFPSIISSKAISLRIILLEIVLNVVLLVDI